MRQRESVHSESAAASAQAWLMPGEAGKHKRTWMAFGGNEQVWGADALADVRRDLAAVAQAISRFEPVSMLVRVEEVDLCRSIVGPDVELIASPIDDIWMRDSGPVFVQAGREKAAVDFNFNGCGNKEEHHYDSQVAAVVATFADVPRLSTELVLEGGGVQVDGEGTAIITESCVLNDNRNPGWERRDVENELRRLLGVQKVIWLPGVVGHDITDGHTDFCARFTSPGVVVAGLEADPHSFDYDVTHRHLRILRSAVDARDRPLRVEALASPSMTWYKESDDFVAGYLNFHVCNGGVIAPEFGDHEADEAARHTLQRLFPGRRIVQINIDAIAAGGGGIHGVTQQEPADWGRPVRAAIVHDDDLDR